VTGKRTQPGSIEPPANELRRSRTETHAAGTPKSINQQVREQVLRQAVREHEAEAARW